ncbi:MbnP family copper-binding protein [Leptospira andrefontaineae]|uniref:Metallo-mystery pair system four-Cys motif protein n=1 Tax=Leptospira andrefontaineae TaxID=2484976 RepID=A0A4R9GZ03_9LEPT|nr:MbnP family copper-binding protein [Leptospira andrefontaineae]TGK36562.1 metallo-mystery pair system four-Cys motif protein [Leptospira andrefontaineae]
MKLLYNAVIAVSSFILIGCDGSSSPNMALLALMSQTAVPGIQFKAVVGDSDAKCGSNIDGHGHASVMSFGKMNSQSNVNIMHVAGAMPITLQDLRFYVSNLELIDQDSNTIEVNVPDDGVWQASGVTLLDFENDTGDCSGTAATNTIIKTSIENKTYKGIRFYLGVPEVLNHLNPVTAPSPLNISGLAWMWSTGYIFGRFEFNATVVNSQSETSFWKAAVHFGSSGCNMGSPYGCNISNRPFIELLPTGGFNPSIHAVRFDLKTLVAGWDIGTAAESVAANSNNTIECHSNQGNSISDTNCPVPFANIGLDYATGQPSGTQSVFSIVAK